ncbi:right-handed parallel beta-helix repeat-containing protein [Roseateles sp. P5_E7]
MVLVSTADAAPFVDAGNTLGVGASIEFNAGVYRTLAEIQDVTIVGADDVSVLATGDYRTTALANAGVGADAGVGAAVALLLSDFTTTAQLTNSTNSSTITGGLTVSADHFARATHAADASVTAADISAGAAIALGVMQGGARAFAGNRMDVAGAVNVTALTDTFMDADATSSSQGVDSDDLFLEFKLDLLLDQAFRALRSALTFDPVTAVDGVADTLTVTGHGLATGDSVIYSKGGDDEQVGALVDTDDYFVRVIDADTISLHNSRDDALNNVNAVDLAPTADFDNLHTLQPRVPGAVAELIGAGRLGTGDGSVGAAAAAAANLDYNSALAGITASAQITADLPVSVISTLDADADAFATAEAVDSAVSLGIAAAANISSQGNQAFVGGSVTAPGIEVRARLGGNGVSDFTAEAISGGGSEANLGVAGAFAVNLSSPLLPLNPIVIPIPALPAAPAIPGLPPITLPTLPPLPVIPVPTGGQQAAVVLDGANLTLLNGRDLLVRSDFIGNYSATTSATPQSTAVVGVGPSVSANAMTQQSLAEIRNAVVTGTGGGVEFRSDIDVIATGDYTATATATAGASSAISLPAAAALNYSDLNTVARIANTSSPSAINGNLRVRADHDSLSTHAANTDSGVGGTASVGAALALGYVLGGAEASSAMDIDVLSGTVTIQADNQSLLDADAVSGQSGAANDPAGDVLTEELEAQFEGLLALAGQGEIPEDVIRILQRASAETADGPIGAAAAVAMNLDFGYSEAALADGSRLETSNAPVVAATGDMDSDALATAASVDAAAGIGVAVAINVDAQRIEGAIGGDITAPAITLETARSGDGIHRLNALAISGAGAEDVGVAGAFALNLSGDPRDILEGDATGGGQLIARILDGANLTLTESTDVTVTATYVGDYNATARAATGGGTLGIGPSVAVNAVVHSTIAEIGAAFIAGADDVIVTATGTYTADTLAVAGADSDGSLPAAIALTGTQNDTIARVRPGETMSTIGGDLLVTASHTATANTTADAASGGADVGLGVAVAAGGPLGGARAEGGPNMTVAGDVTVLANTVADANTDAEASQLGALVSSFTVDEETQRQLKRLATIAGVDDILFPFVDPHPPLQAHFNAETEVDDAANTIKIAVPHEFDAGDAVVYRNNQDDTSLGGLTDGTTYFISFATPDRSQLRLHATRADALAATNAINIAPVLDAEDHHTLVVARTFAAAAVDSTAETINVGNLAGLSDGDAVKYFNGGGTSVGGLVDGRLYFVNVDASDPNAMRVQLFETRADALAGTNVIDLDGAVATGAAHQVVKVVDAYHSRIGAVDPVASVDDGNNRLNIPTMGFANGDSVVYENNGDDETIAGLAAGGTFFVHIVVEEDLPIGLSLHNNRADAESGANAIDIAPAGDSDVAHTLRLAYVVDPAAVVDSDQNTIDLSAARVHSGEAVVYRNGGGASIGGLVDDTVYHVLELPGTGRVVLIDGGKVVDLDASVATGTAHRFERVLVDAPAEDNVPDISVGAAAAIAVGAGRPVSEARIGAGATLVADDIVVTASMDFDADADADALQIGSALGVGVAAAGNYSEGSHIAEVGAGATVTADTLSLTASGVGDLPFDLDANAASAAAGLGGNVAGSVAVNALRNHTAVRIGNDATVTVDGRLDLLANLRRDGLSFVDAGRARSDALAGEVAFGGLAAAGASVAGTITLQGDLVEASIGEGALVTAPDGVNVRAKTLHDFDNTAVGGSISAVFAAAVGAAFNYTSSEARAQVDGSVEVDSGSLDVIATTDVVYDPDALGLAAGGLIAIAGSAEGNVINNTTRAGIGGSGTINANAVRVSASDTSELDTDTGALAASTVGAAGASVAANIMNNTVEAFIAGATVTTDDGNVVVGATSSYDVDALALGLSAAGLVAGVGSVSVNMLTNTTSASIRGGAVIESAGTVSLDADDNSTVQANSGGLAVSLGAGVGASAALNTLDNTVEAYTDDADIEANGDISIDATSANDVDALAIAFGAGGIVGGFASVTINTVTTTTDASIRTGGTIDAPAIRLSARDDSVLDADSGGLAVSVGAGAGGSFARNEMATEVSAGIGGADVTTSEGNVGITATSSFDVDASALGFSLAGLVGGVGTASINDLANTTRAFIDTGAEVDSAGAVQLTALDDSLVVADAGGLAASGFVGAGLSFASSKVINTVEAVIDGTVPEGETPASVTAVGAVTLTATLSPEVSAGAVGFSVGAFAAASGAVAVSETGGRARAAILNKATVEAASVSIQANADAGVDADAGGLAGAGFAAAGVMIAETVAGHGASAEATGVITTGQLDVAAKATRAGEADVNFFGIAAFTGEVGFEAERTAGDTEAIIGEGADITVTGGGSVNVTATSDDVADPHIVDIAAGAFMIGAQATSAVITSNTRAKVAGKVSGRNATVSATSNKEADATTDILNLSILSLNGVALSGIVSALPADLPIPVTPPFDTVADALIDGATEAFLAKGADIDLTGALAVTATSDNDASANNLSLTVTFVNVADTASLAKVQGSTQMHIDEGASIDVGSLTSSASATSDATAGLDYAGVSGVNVQLADVNATTGHLVAAYVGPAKNAPLAGQPATTLAIASGGMNLTATSVNTASVGQVIVDASLVTVEKVNPVADAGGQTRAHLGGAFVINAAHADATATSINTAESEALAFELNLLDIDQSEKSASTTHVTEAFVGQGANLTVSGAINLKASSDNEATIDQITPLDLGAVELNFVKSTANAGGVTVAYVMEDADIRATAITADASADNEASVDRFQFAASVFSLQKAEPTAITSHQVGAWIGAAPGAAAQASLAGTITLTGGITLNATSVNEASVGEVNIALALVSVDLVKPVINTGGTTRVSVGGNYTINATGINGQANATNTAGSDTVPIKLGLVLVTEVNTDVRTTHETEAIVGAGAGFVLSGGGITLGATSRNDARLSRFELGASLVSVGTFSPTVVTQGATRAFAVEGAHVTAGSLSLNAAAANNASVSADIVTIGLVDFSTIAPVVHTEHVVDAYLGPRAGVGSSGLAGSINVAGALNVSAGQVDSGNVASLDSLTISISLGNGDTVEPDVLAAGQTLAHLGGAFAIKAGSVNVTARAPNNRATSEVFALNVGLGNFGGSDIPVTVAHQTAAYVADGANIGVSGGPLALLAEATGHASAENLSISIGLLDIQEITAQARVQGSTKAYIGGGAILNADDVSMLARSQGNTADAGMTSVGVGLISSTTANPTASTEHNVDVFVAGGATVNADDVSLSAVLGSTADADVDTAGFGIAAIGSTNPSASATDLVRAFVDGVVSVSSLELDANASRVSTADTTVVSIGIVGSSGADSTASTTGDTRVAFGSSARITSTGNVAAHAVANNRATAKSSGGGGGVIGAATLDSSATLTSDTTAYLHENAQVLQAGNFELNAIAINTAKADTTAGTGGAISVRGAQATVTVTPSVEAVIDNNVSMQNIGGSVTLHAESLRAEGDSTAKAYGGGVVDVGASNADAIVQPTVNAFIDTGATLDVDGSVTVEAFARAQPAQALNDFFNPDQATIDADSISFTQHGLSNGDRVTYDPNGNSAIGTADGSTLQTGREYSVIVTGEDTLQLGTVFDASTGSTADPLDPNVGVDAARDTIRFAVPHGFISGDAVKYTPAGTSVSTGLNGSNTFFVRSIDEFTIRLYANRDEALGNGAFFDRTFSPVLVSEADDTITSVGHGYVENQAVTYLAPPARQFTSESVDVSSGTPTDNDQIFFQNHGFSVGNRVTYRVEPGGTAIGGLTSGTNYFVIVIDANHIQLAATRDAADPDDGDDDVDTTPIALSPDKNSPANQDQHVLERQTIGGLSNGVTYYVRNIAGSTFQLAATPGGAAIELNGSGRVGTHRLSTPGLDLTAQTGVHQLRLDLTSAPGGNHLLRGEAGVSLRELSPPAGDGQSSAVAKGGGGGFVAVGNPDGNLVLTQNVQAFIAPALLQAGGNVDVRSSSVVNSSAYASNGGGGFVAIGDADANNDTNHSNRAYIGVDDGSGNIVGDNVVVEAQGHLRVSAESTLDAKVTTNADAGGFAADVDAESRGTLDDETQVVAGSNARVTARSVSLRSQWLHLNYTYKADADAGGLYADAEATSNGSVLPDTTTAIRSGAQVTGFEGVDLRAITNDVDIDETGTADATGLFGGEDRYKDAVFEVDTLIDADANAVVTAGPRLFPGPGVPAIDVTPLQQPGGFDRLALFVEIDAEEGTRDMDWDANVVLLPGPNPTLIVGPDGRIQKAINASVLGVGSAIGSFVDPDNNGSFVVADIINDNDRGQALFRADNEGNADITTVLPNGPLFTFRETYVKVDILNQSEYDMVISDIEVVNTFLTTAEDEVIIEVDHVDNFEFDVNHDFKPTLITISNTFDKEDGAQPDITFDGVVNNPIGMTDVFNQRGDILSSLPGGGEFPTPPGLIRTDSFRIDAVRGSVGRGDSQRLRVEIVESNDGPTAAADRYRTSDAGGANFMELRGLLRRALTGSEAVTGFNVDVERILSGNARASNVDLELLNGLLQPTVVPGPYEIEVFESAVVNTPANPPGPPGAPPRTTIVTDHFRQSPGTVATVFPRGVWGAGFNAVDVRYVVGQPQDAQRRISSGRNIDIVGLPQDTTRFINLLGYTDIREGGPFAAGNIDVLTNGHITLTEELGDMRIGRIESTQRNVNLTGRLADIIDAPDDPEADVLGVNLTFSAPQGRVGTFENALEIDSSHPSSGVVRGDAASDIVLIETELDMNVDRIRSESGDVSLTTVRGSILDAFDDAAADSIGVNLFFFANSGRIGDSANDFDIDSSTARPGRLFANASSSIYLLETDSSMNVQQVLSPGGIIRLTVPDTIATDEDLYLMEGGLIFSNEAGITLNVGDDVDTRLESLMFTPSTVTINGDFGDADPGRGSRIVLRGAIFADRTTIQTLRDDDEVRVENSILNSFIFTSGGDDLIFGSDAGSDDPDLNDTTYFGDFIDAGPGNDRVFGLGGADMIFGRDGDDIIEGGAHGDNIDGGGGDDDLRGGFGNDLIHGGTGFDDIDGGRDNDILFGDEDDDRIDAGTGGINIIFGGAGDDVLNGSDEGRDGIDGGEGRDYVFGHGGNDVLLGGAGDDIVDGGAGDDIIQGGAGKDVLLGGADHDVLSGDDTTAGDDNAVDYLYGDFGTNGNEPGSGRDRLDGQGGNDVLFGEGEDDEIIDTLGASNLINAGPGDNPAVIVLPAATPNPVVAVSTDDPLAVNTLPAGPAYAGWWAEIAGSATNFGLSGGVGDALDTTVAVDPLTGERYVAWADGRNGNHEIYVAKATAAGWVMLGGSAAGGGVSDTAGHSRLPSLAIINGRPTVVWSEVHATGIDIMGAQYDEASDTWVTLGNSLLPGGISNTARANQAQIVETEGRALVTWIDTSSGSAQIYGRVFNGASWVEITPGSATGGGITHAASVAEYDVAAEGDRIAVTWSGAPKGAVSRDDVEIYALVRQGAGWVGLAVSDSGTGLSNSPANESREPDAAWLNGQLFVAYRERVGDFEQIYVKTYEGGNFWVSAGPDGAVKQGVSNTVRRSLDPKLESGGGELFLVWADHSNFDYADTDARLYAKRWNGSQFVETLPGDATGGGISATGGKFSALDLTVDAQGRPTVGWTDDSAGLPQAYLRTVTALPGQVFVAAGGSSVQAILNANDLGAGDVIVLAAGVHAGFTVGAGDAGVTILGAQGGGSVVTGAVNLQAAGVLQRLSLSAGVTVGAGASGAALVDNLIGSTGLVINGGSQLQVLHNRFNGTTGVTLAGAASGLIAHNDVFASATGLAINAAFSGSIDDNDFRNADVGVRYNAAAPLGGNRIHDNTTGIISTVAGTTNALGFVAGSTPNEIDGNKTGVELQAARMQNQHLTGNTLGVTGSGILGGADLSTANVIEGGVAGVASFSGSVQFNRIGLGRFGVLATEGNVIEGNQIYRTTLAAVVASGVANVRIEGNTMASPAGDLIRVAGGAKNVEVLHNTLWAESGYDIFVANNSQAGFFSDFNNLYTSGTGKVGFWTRDFSDVLDWQADIARFDLHSVGATVVNPEWARPRFESRHNDEYALMPMFGTQRFTSPLQTPEPGVAHIALRSPDLYVDAVRERALPIQWESFNNTVGSRVRIDLYRDTADGPAFLTTITAATADDGEFLWTPEDSGIAFGTHGLRIQVSWVDNPLVLDRSQEPFVVPEDGSDYFVDDASNVNDEFTPGAIGNNRNTGKLPTAPKPYVTNLARVYDLQAGDTVHIDTGSYSMIDPLVVSGSTDRGFGLDQGFTLTGPTNTARIAELLPAIPGDRSRPLIELDDADGIAVEHLTLRDAQRGLYAHGGSDGLSASHVTASGHLLEGIRIETRSPAGSFTELTSTNNGGVGVHLAGEIGSLTGSSASGNAGGGFFVGAAVSDISQNNAISNTGIGFDIRNPGAATIQRNLSFGNTRGMVVSNAGGGAPALVGSTTLAPLTANVIFQNVLSGLTGRGNVMVAGNTVVDQTDAAAIGIRVENGATARSNVVRGNGIGIDANDATVLGNRVFGNSVVGIRANDAELLENVVYSNPVGIEITGADLTVRNNIIYDSTTVGLRVNAVDGLEIVNNTFFEPTADAIRIEGASKNVNVRNDIIWAQSGIGIAVDADSQAGFSADNNVFFRAIFGTGRIGTWDGVERATLASWKAATGTDTDSIFANPLFVDANGADNVLGFEAGVSDGRDDDFHVRSLFGSFHGGSLAPVEGPSFIIPGSPVALTAVETIDAQQSSAIDRGDPSDPFNREPANNGGYVNVGAYGNTEQASKSAAEFIIVIAPNGGEVIEQQSVFDIRWNHAGGTTVDIEVSSTGPAGTFETIAAGEANDGLYQWTVDPTLFPAGDDYVIRVVSSADATISDISNATFEIDEPPLQVLALTPNVSGFAVRFNRALDLAQLNLYDGAGPGAALGAADIVVTGPAGQVRGSVVMDADNMGFAFVKTGSALADGSYTVTLTSGAAALHAVNGDLLDGNADHNPGDDFSVAFNVSGSAAAKVSIADFARGPGQEAGVPTGAAGVPVRISGAGSFITAAFEIHFDPTLLLVTGFSNPAGGTATVDLSTPGVARVQVVFAVAVSGADLELGRLIATVPATAPYGARQVLDVRNVSVNGTALAAGDEDGVHVVARPGDTDGNAAYSSQDALYIQRVVARLDTGFKAFPLIDSLIVGDVNGSGRLESADALLIQRKILGLPTPIPDAVASPPAAKAIEPSDVARSLEPVPRSVLSSAPLGMAAAGPTQVGAPVIDWNARPASAPAVPPSPKADQGQDWLDSFVNHLGRTQDERNAAFRLRISAVPTVAPKATVTLSTMERR